MTNFDKEIPTGVLFSLREIEEMKIIKTSTLKKLIRTSQIESTKIGNKHHIARAELIRYLKNNTS